MDATQALYLHNVNRITQDTALDILADAPQQIDYLGFRMGKSSTLQETHRLFESSHIVHHDPFTPGKPGNPALPYVVSVGGLLINQALYFVANNDAVELTIKSRFAQMLAYIGNSIGVRQALVFADALASRGNQGVQ